MSPPHLRDQEDEGQSNVTTMPSRASVAGIRQNSLMERNYLGLSECVPLVKARKTNLNLKATELRLGLPGSESPERDSDTLFSSSELDEKPLFPLHPLRECGSSSVLKIVTSGSKRGFYDAMDVLSESEKLGTSDVDVVLSPHPSSNLTVKSGPKILVSTISDVDSHTKVKNTVVATNDSPPASKAQVVGWPPIRSFRKNSLASKNAEVDGKALFIKVSMDGAPYLRKIDLKAYNTYKELSSSLEKMFSWITIGQCASHGIAGREMLSESKLKDLIHGSEYVLTYEDKDSDWMLVGDVPWEMFIFTCKRLRIMKSSNAIGLAPRAVEKSRNRI